MSDLDALIERLEKLDGPSREVEIELWRMFIQPDAPEHRVPLPWAYGFTESIDAIVALIGKLGFQWLKKSPESMTVYSPLTAVDDAAKRWAVHYSAAGATPAIALCIALLQAIKEREVKP